MDEQDPRLAAERISGRGVDETIGLDRNAVEPRSTTRRAGNDPAVSPSAAGYAPAGTGADADDERRAREIRADIEQTREELSETVTAIQDRLRPANMAANAADTVKTAAAETARDVIDSEPVQYVRANPIPAAMIGIGVAGLAWLAFGGRETRTSDRRYQYRGMRQAAWPRQPGGAYDNSATGYSGYATSPYDADIQADTTGRTNRYASSARTRRVTARAQNQLTRTWNESPMLIGAAAMVAGAIVGLAVPETERENQLMGEARDNVVDKVQRTVGEKVSQVQDAATDAVGHVQEAAKNAVGMTDTNSSS